MQCHGIARQHCTASTNQARIVDASRDTLIEITDKWYVTGVATDWEGALKIAWTEAVALVEYLHDTNAEHANRIVGTIGDTLPGYAAGQLNNRGFTNESAYVTLQIGIPKSLKRTGKPFQP